MAITLYVNHHVLVNLSFRVSVDYLHLSSLNSLMVICPVLQAAEMFDSAVLGSILLI